LQFMESKQREMLRSKETVVHRKKATGIVKVGTRRGTHKGATSKGHQAKKLGGQRGSENGGKE